jgi:hypothetical protein
MDSQVRQVLGSASIPLMRSQNTPVAALIPLVDRVLDKIPDRVVDKVSGRISGRVVPHPHP